MSNPIDDMAIEIEEEIRARFQNEEDASVRAAQEFRAACFKCAVLKQKLKIEQDLNREDRVNWKGKA